MVKRVKVFTEESGRLEVPADCLAELGVPSGEWATVRAAPGRLVITPAGALGDLTAEVGSVARELDAVRTRLRDLAVGMAAAVPADYEGGRETEILGTLQCVLADAIEPALAMLGEAAAGSPDRSRA